MADFPYLPTCPQARMQVSCKWIVSCSDIVRNNISAAILLLIINSWAIPAPRRNPGNVRLFQYLLARYIKWTIGSYPAAIRSSRMELWRDCRHHWPKEDLLKSINSWFVKCTVNRFKAIIARTLGLRDSWNLWEPTSLLRIRMASSLTEWAPVVFPVTESAVRSQSWHFEYLIVLSSSQTTSRLSLAAHGIMPRYSIAWQRVVSSNSVKHVLIDSQFENWEPYEKNYSAIWAKPVKSLTSWAPNIEYSLLVICLRRLRSALILRFLFGGPWYASFVSWWSGSSRWNSTSSSALSKLSDISTSLPSRFSTPEIRKSSFAAFCRPLTSIRQKLGEIYFEVTTYRRNCTLIDQDALQWGNKV